MPPTLKLPRADGTVAPYTLSGRAPIQAPPGPIKSRIGMAAVHVVADPRAAINPTLEVALDWDVTLRFRHYLWSLGLAVAEAMDTSQRGMGFDWTTAKQLIKRSVAESRRCRVGAGLGAERPPGGGAGATSPTSRGRTKSSVCGSRGAVAGSSDDGPVCRPRAPRARRLREDLRPYPESGA